MDRTNSSPNDHEKAQWLVKRKIVLGEEDAAEQNKNLRSRIKKYCSVAIINRRLPVTRWLRNYSLRDLQGDAVAGITVGLTVIPQALAYSAIAELPIEYGLYSSFMGCFVYTLLGTSKDLTLGTTAIISLLTASSYPVDAGAFKPQYAVLLAFLTGIIQLLFGVLNLGFLINFISAPVISGFISASAFIILYGQVKSVLGVKFGRSTDGVIEQTRGYFTNLHKINGWDVLLGCCCLTILTLLKRLNIPKKPKSKQNESQPNRSMKRLANSIIRAFSIGRYGIVVIVAGFIGFLLETFRSNEHSITLTSNVHAELPPISVPAFSFGNKTFATILHETGPGLAVVSLVGAMESIAIAKAFAFQYGYDIDATQEFLALGMANFLSSFVSSYPVTGSFTKSALNAQSGVRTPMGCAFTGVFVLVSITLLSPVFRYIPKAALGAIIISAVSGMFEFHIFVDLWKVNRKELVPLVSTVLVSLLCGVDWGLLAGISTSLALVLYPFSRPPLLVHKDITISERVHVPALDDDSKKDLKVCLNVCVAPDAPLYFPSAEYVKDLFRKEAFELRNSLLVNKADFMDGGAEAQELMNAEEVTAVPHETVVTVDGHQLHLSDYTTLRSLRAFVNSCQRAGVAVRFINTPAHILSVVLPGDLLKESIRIQERRPEGTPVRTPGPIVLSRSVSERIAEDSAMLTAADPEGDLDVGYFVE